MSFHLFLISIGKGDSAVYKGYFEELAVAVEVSDMSRLLLYVYWKNEALSCKILSMLASYPA